MKKTFLLAISALFAVILSSCSQKEIDLEYIPVCMNNKFGYINQDGEVVINYQFLSANIFHEGLARVITHEYKVGYIGKDGLYVIPAQYERGTDFSEGLAFVVTDESCPICINKKGEKVFELPNAKSVCCFEEDLALFEDKNEKYGYVNKEGQIVISPQFDDAHLFSDGLAGIKQDEKYGYIDKTGKIVINPQFDDANHFSEGLAVIKLDGKYGYIDKKGKIVISPQFDDARDFSDGLALIEQGEKRGYIDKTGKIVINPQYDIAWDFSEGLAPVKQDEKYCYIDKTGKIVINPQFDFATRFYGDIAIVFLNNKIGIIDKDGRYKVYPQFEEFNGECRFNNNVQFKYIDLRSKSNYIESFYIDKEEFSKFLLDNSGYSDFRGISANTTYRDILREYKGAKKLTERDEYSIEVLNKDGIFGIEDWFEDDVICVSCPLFVFEYPYFENVTTYSYYSNVPKSVYFVSLFCFANIYIFSLF